MKKKSGFFFWTVLFILFLSAVGLYLRMNSVTWGLVPGDNGSYHPSEAWTAKLTKNFWTGQPDPGFYHYPTLFYELTFLFQLLVYAAGRLTGYFHSLEAFQAIFMKPGVISQPLIITGRIVSAIMGALTIPLTYHLGRKIFNRATGMLAAVFLTFCYAHIEESHYGVTDVTATFFVTLAVFFAYRIYSHGDRKAYLLTGLATGLAAATKFPVAPIVLAGPAAHFGRLLLGRISLKRFFLSPFIYLLAVMTVIGLLIGCPFLITSFEGYFHQLTDLSQTAFESWDYGEADSWWGTALNYGAMLFRGIDPFQAGLFFVGLLIYCFRHPKGTLVLCAFPLGFLLFLSSMNISAIRFILPLFPLCLVFSAYGLWQIIDRLVKNKKRAAAVLVLATVLLLVFPFYRILWLEKIFTLEDTRTTAQKWLLRHLTKDDLVIRERYTPALSNFCREETVNFLGHLDMEKLDQTDFLITSSQAYDRFFRGNKDKFSEQRRRYRHLEDHCEKVKEFHLIDERFFFPETFLHPTLTVYAPPTYYDKPDDYFHPAEALRPLHRKITEITYLPLVYRCNGPDDMVYLDGSLYGRENLAVNFKRHRMAQRRIVFQSWPRDIFLYVHNREGPFLLQVKMNGEKTVFGMEEKAKRMIRLKPRSSRLCPLKNLLTLEMAADTPVDCTVYPVFDLYRAAILETETGRWEEAVTLLREIETERTIHPEEARLLAACLIHEGGRDEARAVIAPFADEIQAFYDDTITGSEDDRLLGYHVQGIDSSLHQSTLWIEYVVSKNDRTPQVHFPADERVVFFRDTGHPEKPYILMTKNVYPPGIYWFGVCLASERPKYVRDLYWHFGAFDCGGRRIEWDSSGQCGCCREGVHNDATIFEALTDYFSFQIMEEPGCKVEVLSIIIASNIWRQLEENERDWERLLEQTGLKKSAVTSGKPELRLKK